MSSRGRVLLPSFAAVVAVATLLGGCANGSVDAEASGDGRTVDTVLGPVTVPDEVESVVVIEGRRDLDIALALDLPVVGFPLEAQGALELQTPLADAVAAAAKDGAEGLFLADEINIEAIAEVAPSLIISRASDVEPILEELEAIAPVLAVGEQGVSTWQDDLRLVGEATGTADRADALIAEYDARVVEIADAYADVIADNTVVPLGTDAEGSQVRPDRLLSTVLRDIGATPSEAFASSIEAGDGVEFGPEELFDAYQDADGIVALVNVADEWAATQANPLWQQLPAVQAGRVVRSDKSTHEGGPITALHALDVIESLYQTF